MMDTERRRWLCVAYAFPPINRSGTHRTAAFVRHLHALGWDAEVITVRPDAEPVDGALLENIPASTGVHRTRWFDAVEVLRRPFRRIAHEQWTRSDSARLRHTPGKCDAPDDGSSARAEARGSLLEDRGCSGPSEGRSSSDFTPRRLGVREWVSRFLKTPDSRLGWLPFGIAAGVRSVLRNRPDVLYSTSPYASAHLIALALHRLHRIPWVADFRDPWIGNPYTSGRQTSLPRWNAYLERAVVRSASAVVCNTPTLRDSMLHRHPWAEAKFQVIPNGIDLDVIEQLVGERIAPKRTFVLVHAGQFYGPRKPTLLFEGLRRTVEQSGLKQKVRLALIGCETYDGRPLRELAAAAGVGEHVAILGSLPHTRTLTHLMGADALVLIGSAGEGAELQVPNKLYEYLGVRKPILACVPSASPTATILREARAETVLCDPGDADAIGRAIRRIVEGSHDRPADAWSGVTRFDRARRAEGLAALFSRLAPAPRRKLDTPKGADRVSPLAEAWTCG